jgi:hypothetical protein
VWREGSDVGHLILHQLALEFLAFAEQLIAALPKGRSHRLDEVEQPASISLNIAEDAGQYASADKATPARRPDRLRRAHAHPACPTRSDVSLASGMLLASA